MATAETIDEPETAEPIDLEVDQLESPEAQPLQLPDLVLRVASSIPEAGPIISRYFRAALDHEAECRALADDIDAAIAHSGKTSVAKLKSKGEALKERQAELAEARKALLWQRHAACNDLLPLFRENAANEKRAYLATRQRMVDHFRDLGIDAYAFNAGQFNQRASIDRLNHLVDSELEVLAAFAAANRANHAAEILGNAAKQLPNVAHCRISWPKFSGEQLEVAKLAGIA